MITGPNSNSIFLPAAGLRDGTGLSNGGSYGVYWSSSLTTGLTYDAQYVYFYNGNLISGGYLRYYCLSVLKVTV